MLKFRATTKPRSVVVYEVAKCTLLKFWVYLMCVAFANNKLDCAVWLFWTKDLEAIFVWLFRKLMEFGGFSYTVCLFLLQIRAINTKCWLTMIQCCSRSWTYVPRYVIVFYTNKINCFWILLSSFCYNNVNYLSINLHTTIDNKLKNT